MKLLLALMAGTAGFLIFVEATGQQEALARLPRQRTSRLSRTIWLRQAGLNISPATFWAVSASAGAVGLLVCWALAGSFLVGFVPAVVAGLGPRTYFGRERSRRLGLVVEAWPDAVGELKSYVALRGSMHEALLELSRTGPAPMQDAFARYDRLSQLSSSTAALATIQDELADPVSDRLLTLMRLAITEGQATTIQLLADQADQLVADLRTAAEIRTSQHEARLVNRIALVAPWGILLLLCMGETGYRTFYASGAAVLPSAIAGFFSLAGLAVTTRLAREAAPPRVLGAR